MYKKNGAVYPNTIEIIAMYKCHDISVICVFYRYVEMFDILCSLSCNDKINDCSL
jgi:hypothetical protein